MTNKIFFTEKNGLFSIPIPVENFTVNDSNSEFTDGLFVSWSYPLELFLNKESRRKLGNIQHANNSNGKFILEGSLNKYGEVFPAKMNILTLMQNKAKINFEYGVGSLAVMDKKLSEIDLGTITYNNLYDYIDATLFQSYPQTPVCFPRIHTPKKWLEDIGPLYGGRNIYNDVDTSLATKILRNEFTTNGQAIFNFIKPIVYWLHILNKGFESSGYLLKGDILTDTDIEDVGFNHNNMADMLVVQDIKRIPYNFSLVSLGGVSKDFDVIGSYYFSLILDNDTSTVNMKVINVATLEVLYENNKNGQYVEEDQYGVRTIPTDLEYIYLLPNFTQTTKLRVSLSLSNFAGHTNAAGEVFIAYLNPAGGGDSKKSYVLPGSLILNKYVPDVNFVDVVKAVKNLKNYGLTVMNNEIHMNKIKNTLPDKVVDLQFSEQNDVEISSNARTAYILRYNAPEEYGFLDFQYDKIGLVKNQIKIVDEGLEVREMSAYPLPFTDNLIAGNSANQLSDEVQGLPMIKYDGFGSINNANSLDAFSIPNIYINSYKNWFFGRLDCKPFKWNFYSKKPEAVNLKSTDCIFAYGAFHKINTIQKKYHENNIVEIEIDSENRY